MDCYLLAVDTMNELGVKPSKELPVPKRSESLIKNFSTSETRFIEPEMGEEGRKDTGIIANYQNYLPQNGLVLDIRGNTTP